MAIEFVCPWCTQDISADETKTGTTIECPHCNFPVKVPAKSTHEPLPSLPPSSPSSTDTPASGLDSAESEPPLPPASPPQPARVPLKRGAILKAAIKERQAGKPAEEVYKTYQGQVRPNNALAVAIASVADPERKRRYAVLNYVLVALLVLTALSVMFSNLSPGLMVLRLIVPLYFAFAIARFDGRAYSFLILLLLFNALNTLFEKGKWPLKLSEFVWFAAFIAVAFVAQRKIFPNMRLFRVKKGSDGSYVWCDQERLFAEASSSGTPPPVTAPQGIPVSKRSRFLVILILIALVLFVGVIIRFGSGSKVTLAPREDAIAYYNRGNAKDDKGDLDGAIADYNRAIELDPKLAIAYNNRGNAEKAKGDLSGAIADYNRAIELDPKHASAYYNRGNVKDARGDLDGAIADFNLAIELDPKDADAYTNRGRCKEAKGDLDTAIADYNRAIELDPKFAIAYNNRGNAKKKAKGDLDGAIADYNRAIELNPKYGSAYYNRGNAKEAKGDLDGAIADFKRATELDPKLAIVYKFRGAAKNAKVPLASSASPIMTPAPGVNLRQVTLEAHLSFYKMHSNLLNMTRWMQVRHSAFAYKQITRKDLRDFDEKTRDVLAWIDRVLGELPVSDQEPWRVRRALLSACSEQARLFEANWNDWHASGVKPKKGEAKPWQKEAMRLQSEIDAAEKRDKELSYNSSGAEKLKNGDVNGAITDFNQAVELDPRYANAYHNRAYAKVKKKQYAAAIEDIQRAIQLDPKNGDYYLSLGWHELFNRKPRESIAASLKALELSPDNALIINGNLAHAYLFDNQFDKAKAIYLENKDAKLRDGRAFSQSVLDDFKEFQEAGITHPDMEKIKALFAGKDEQ